MALPRWFCKLNCEHFPNEPDLQRFSGKAGVKSGEKNQCLPDSWSICRLRVWIAPFRDSRCRAAGTRFRVTFCGLADYRPIPRNTKVRPAYRDIECVAQNRQKWKKPCAALNTQHRAKVDLEMSKWVELFTMLNFRRNTFSRFSNCRIFFFPSSISAVNFSRVFSLGFVMVGCSFLPVGIEKGQSIFSAALVK